MVEGWAPGAARPARPHQGLVRNAVCGVADAVQVAVTCGGGCIIRRPAPIISRCCHMAALVQEPQARERESNGIAMSFHGCRGKWAGERWWITAFRPLETNPARLAQRAPARSTLPLMVITQAGVAHPTRQNTIGGGAWPVGRSIMSSCGSPSRRAAAWDLLSLCHPHALGSKQLCVCERPQQRIVIPCIMIIDAVHTVRRVLVMRRGPDVGGGGSGACEKLAVLRRADQNARHRYRLCTMWTNRIDDV
jgi:hypothetical protein